MPRNRAFVGLQLKRSGKASPSPRPRPVCCSPPKSLKRSKPDCRGASSRLVVDPVCVSQSGQRLLREDAVNALRWHILPKADLLTPNRPEAELLADMKIDSEKDIDVAARKLLDMGPKAVLIKGAFRLGLRRRIHGLAGSAGRTAHRVEAAWRKTSNNHGTGCTLSAAIATYFGAWPRDPGCHRARPEVLNHCLRHGYAGARGGSAEPRFMDCQAGWRIAFPAEKRGRPHAVAPGTPVLVFFSAVSLVPLSREIRFPAYGRFIACGNAALPSMPICFIFFYYDDIRSLSPLAAMRPLLSRTDLDQPALSLPPHVFVFSLFAIRASPRSVCACAPQDDGVFYVFCIACEALVFLVLCHRV